MNYDNPNYLIIREERLAGAFSASAVSTIFVGTTLKVYTKCAVLGVTFVTSSGGSVGGGNTIAVCRVDATGTSSIFQATLCTIQKTTSAAGDVFDISLSAPMTLSSTKEFAALAAGAATLADKSGVISDVIWRFRMLPKLAEKIDNR